MWTITLRSSGMADEEYEVGGDNVAEALENFSREAGLDQNDEANFTLTIFGEAGEVEESDEEEDAG